MKVTSINGNVNFSATLAPKLNKNGTPAYSLAVGPLFYCDSESSKNVNNLLKAIKTILTKVFHK